MAKLSTLSRVKARGFDRSTSTRTVPPAVAVSCSQCEALVINGMATHETGCPNQTYDCKGCDAHVPRRGMYCEDCQS